MVEKEDLDLVCVYVCVCVYIESYCCSSILLCSFVFNWTLSLQTLSLPRSQLNHLVGLKGKFLKLRFHTVEDLMKAKRCSGSIYV